MMDEATKTVLRITKDVLTHCGYCHDCYMLLSSALVVVIRHNQEVLTKGVDSK